MRSYFERGNRVGIVYDVVNLVNVQEMEDEIETVFTSRNVKYRLKLSVKRADTIGILLLDEDTPDRWAADITAAYIHEVTIRVGQVKDIAIFWKMLQAAATGKSREVSLGIMTPEDAAGLVRSSGSQSIIPRDDKRFLVVTHITEFQTSRFPLLLTRAPYSMEELQSMIRRLKAENTRLKAAKPPTPEDSELVQQLQLQIFELNGQMAAMCTEKDEEIEKLQKKIDRLNNQLKTNRTGTTRSRVTPTRVRDRSPSVTSDHENTRRTSRYRAPSESSNGSRKRSPSVRSGRSNSSSVMSGRRESPSHRRPSPSNRRSSSPASRRESPSNRRGGKSTLQQQMEADRLAREKLAPRSRASSRASSRSSVSSRSSMDRMFTSYEPNNRRSDRRKPSPSSRRPPMRTGVAPPSRYDVQRSRRYI